METISATQYTEFKTRSDRYRSWLGDRTSYRPEEVPADCVISNEERSAIEVYEFVNNPPKKYFLYINEETSTATTWTGDKLGSVSFGRVWRDNLGGQRQSIKVYGINSKNYHGTYYKSSGNYARVTQFK